MVIDQSIMHLRHINHHLFFYFLLRRCLVNRQSVHVLRNIIEPTVTCTCNPRVTVKIRLFVHAVSSQTESLADS